MNKKLTWIGCAISVLYLIAAVALGWGKWDEIAGLKPNEVGDFLAGVAGPLALLWLILGYFQQGEELRNSSQALQMQAKELAESVRQQAELVRVSRDQFEAQQSAIERSMEAERIARLPKLTLHYKSQPHTVNGRVFVFDVENSGARANDIKLWLSPTLTFSPATTTNLKPGSHFETTLQGAEMYYAGDHQIVATYSDTVGMDYRTTFRVGIFQQGSHWHVKVLNEDLTLARSGPI